MGMGMRMGMGMGMGMGVIKAADLPRGLALELALLLGEDLLAHGALQRLLKLDERARHRQAVGRAVASRVGAQRAEERIGLAACLGGGRRLS